MSVNSKMTAIANAIRAKTGKTAPLNLDQMVTEIEGITGGTELFAVIAATYPAGSTIKCVSGSTELSPVGTDGQCVFAVPFAGTWTVTSTDGTNTKIETVEITTEGQSVSVILAYWNGELYDAGNEYAAITGGWTSVVTGIGSVTKNTDHLYVSTGSGAGDAASTDAVTQNPIDLSEFSVLKMVVSGLSTGGGGGEFYLYVTTKSGKAWSEGVPSKQFTAKGTIELDVSGLTGKYYVGCHIGPWQNYWAKITKMWLE